LGGGRHAREGFFFEPQVGMDVDLRCLDGFMSAPQRNDSSIDAALQQIHRRRVA
jgi:hypothetical protein